MDLGLRDRVAIVAAASRGLGKAVAIGLAREGVRVTILARGRDTLNATAEEIRRETGADVLPLPADVTRQADVKRVVEETLKKWGRVDILVNNAGGPPSTSFLQSSVEDFRRAIDLNLMSAIMLCKEAVPLMVQQRWGRVINIVSIAAMQPLPGLLLSNAVRPGVLGLAKTMSNELSKEGITVNSVCPGYTETDRVKELMATRVQRTGETEEEVRRAYAADIPMGRIGQPDELAAVVVFLASERASYVTGAVIPVDGGSYEALF
jgi:3-oxoacyl-[acyl-carrier protein] reductase